MSDSRQKFLDLLKDFDSAMLVTRAAGEELRARPMAIAGADDEGTLWFFTDRESGKADEIAAHPGVNVTMQGGRKFLSLTGTARLVDDGRKVDELWNETYKVWFPGGKTDPGLILLAVDGGEGEYWDNSGRQGIKYLFEAGKAYLSGERPKVDQGIHGKAAL